MKFIFVSGGVISGLGKGVTAASIGLLLKSSGIKVTLVKCDMYLNIDAGTMNPLEHGEIFVTHDGIETDQDLGHYERFTNETLNVENYLTNGQIYKIVLDKERALEFDGKCVQPYYHIPTEIISRWFKAGRKHKAEVVIVELGGTVGEYEGLLFFESVRRLKLKYPENVLLVHVGYLPLPTSIGELKSKPLQQSVQFLNSLGLNPDIIIGRAEKEIDLKRKEKIALASGLSPSEIFSNPDVKSIYEVPLILKKQGLNKKLIKKLNLKRKRNNLGEWMRIVKRIKNSKGFVKIGIVGKYQKTGDYTLEDSYISVVEALKHACAFFKVCLRIFWIDSEELENLAFKEVKEKLSKLDAVVVPQGWGKRGTEGKILAARVAREEKIPYLGLCFGMQMATIEFARNVLGFKDANTQEANPQTKHPVIHIMPNQKEYLQKRQYGGTIRLGAWPCVLKRGSRLEKLYLKYGRDENNPWFVPRNLKKIRIDKKFGMTVFERHRHRYEFNLKYKNYFEKKGFIVSGFSPDKKLVEAIELKDHPFFIGTQFHPEYLSRPLTPHPIFLALIKSTLDGNKEK